MTIFAHWLFGFVWRQLNNQKGLTPANGFSPNFILIQKVLSDSNNFFSDFIKYSPKETNEFIERLAILINNGAFRYVIINDISLFYGTGTGYSCIESLARKMESSDKFNINCWRFHFKYPNEYQPTYGRKLNDSLYFPIDVDRIGMYNPFATCRSILYISSITPNS